jgi:hypothetical protein
MSDNIFILEESSSDESETSSEEEIEALKDLNQEFLNETKVEDYLKNHKSLFTRDIEKRIIVVDSHTENQNSNFDTSNYTIKFQDDKTNNYEIFNNVIGFRLLKASIRSPPYNVNDTNNVIYYSNGGDILTVTINPGLYTLSELADVFGKPHDVDDGQSHNYETHAQFVTYSLSKDFQTGGISKVKYSSSSDTSTDSNGKGIRYKFQTSGEFKLIWDKNDVTRGAARLFGFYPVETPASSIHYSDKTPDISHHYVDLVIPEIPDKACKIRSYGKNVIDRISLYSFHGEYIHYRLDDNYINYFYPIKLHELTIQLFSEDKTPYNCNNADNSFEFELTIVNNVNLLK